MEKCISCTHYEAFNGKGYCKFAHPDISPTQSGIQAVWPVVAGEDKACGDFTKILPGVVT
jgi:hypothetical protein